MTLGKKNSNSRTYGAVGFTFELTASINVPALYVFTIENNGVISNTATRVYDPTNGADEYYTAIHVGGDTRLIVSAALAPTDSNWF